MQKLHNPSKFAQIMRADSPLASRAGVEWIGAALVVGTLTLDAVTPAGYAGGMFYILPIVLGLWADAHYVVVVTLISTALTVLGLYVPSAAEVIPWTAYLNRAGAIFSIWVTAFGVLSHRRVTASLERSEAQSRAILEGAVEGIVTIDERGTIRSFNRAAEKMFGLSAAEAKGKNVGILMPAAERDQHDGHLKRYLATGRARAIGPGRELTAVRADGSEFPVQLSLAAIQCAGERMFTGVIRDITEAKEAQAVRERCSVSWSSRTRSSSASPTPSRTT
jgi:PAS domain S-box-containing protein